MSTSSPATAKPAPAPDKTNAVRIYRRLLRYVVPYWRHFALAILALVLLAATEPLAPALLKPLLDGGIVELTKHRSPITVPLLLVGLFFVRGVLTFGGTVAMHWVAHKLVADLRIEIFAHLVRLPARYYDEHSSGVILSKIAYDVSQIAVAATRVLQVLIKDSLAIVGLVLYLVYLDWRLSTTVFALAPLIAWVVRALSQRLRSVSRRLQGSMGGITDVAQEAIDAHRVVKIYGGQPYEDARFRAAAHNVRHLAMKLVVASGANVPSIQILVAFGLAFTIYIATLEARTGTLSVGEFMAFFAAMTLLLGPVKRITQVNEDLQQGLAAAESAFSVLDLQPEDDTGKVVLRRATGNIRLSGVGLRYQDDHRPALADIDLQIRSGETLALVGPSGSGKSSLIGLLPRLYEPTTGHIELDGHDLRALTLASLRENIALVSQDVVLFNDTLYNNIAYGAMRDDPPEAILAAAEAAHVMDFVAKLPEGLHTHVGEHGVRLSGGERQRIAIARALLKDAPILILDEATSALDSVAERQIQDALERLRHGRTCLIIAHRLSTVESADRILVLEHGRIAELGTHEELIAKEGLYARLHALQLAGLSVTEATASGGGRE